MGMRLAEKRRTLLLFSAFGAALAFAARRVGAQPKSPSGVPRITQIPQPEKMDLCPVCGMLVSKYPNWVAVVVYRDGHAHFFDGAKDLFKYLPAPEKFVAGHRREDVAAIWVTEYYGLKRIDASKAYFVIGSDVLGPMGHELVPLESEADANDFLLEHKGKRVLGFDQVTPEVIRSLD